MRRTASRIALLALVALVGCGGPKSSEEPTPEERLPAPAAVVTSECRAASAVYEGTVRCPTRLTSSRDPERIEFGGRARTAPCTWQIGLQLRGPAFHVLFGGQCRPLPLEADGTRWPRSTRGVEGQLGLIGAEALTPDGGGGRDVKPTVVRDDVTVNGAPAMLVAYTGYPQAGTVHAGHQALLWNEGGEGLVVSGHFDADVPAALRLRLLKAVAESMRPVT